VNAARPLTDRRAQEGSAEGDVQFQGIGTINPDGADEETGWEALDERIEFADVRAVDRRATWIRSSVFPSSCCRWMKLWLAFNSG
jgi:hypothetical protein